ncbi:hypothetical protein K469DRAFT_753179 [Zopfia rhizophila CBS 207.26]|uniref:Uncharacterized protein n=1 Tax=Zopfia rhizophila CBS 207.26 TaxID=1314779 RepID=A0A6A6DSA5_9PEZI|nr:hypothetical protein K469DRAFT_753179 [Zopfia rhizophila CBS 207.26]
MNSSQFEKRSMAQDTAPPSFSRARRPALIPPNSSLSLAEAEELVRTRINQPLFPPPDPNLLRNLRSASPTRSDSSNLDFVTHSSLDAHITRDQYLHSNPNPSTKSPSIPASIARDPRRRALWIKARAHYARDWNIRRFRSTQQEHPSPNPDVILQNSVSVDVAPKRKHSAFILDEELKCQLEDSVGTPHLSEMVPGDDVSAQLNMEELSMGGRVSAMDGEVGIKDGFTGSFKCNYATKEDKNQG